LTAAAAAAAAVDDDDGAYMSRNDGWPWAPKGS
jgi:hypothetical protein